MPRVIRASVLWRCEYYDVAENLAIDRAKELFQAECNVQPHRANANLAVYFAAVHADTVLAMNLDHGGHLTLVLG